MCVGDGDTHRERERDRSNRVYTLLADTSQTKMQNNRFLGRDLLHLYYEHLDKNRKNENKEK